jgi:hypothetical protein
MISIIALTVLALVVASMAARAQADAAPDAYSFEAPA